MSAGTGRNEIRKSQCTYVIKTIIDSGVSATVNVKWLSRFILFSTRSILYYTQTTE